MDRRRSQNQQTRSQNQGMPNNVHYNHLPPDQPVSNPNYARSVQYANNTLGHNQNQVLLTQNTTSKSKLPFVVGLCIAFLIALYLLIRFVFIKPNGIDIPEAASTEQIGQVIIDNNTPVLPTIGAQNTAAESLAATTATEVFAQGVYFDGIHLGGLTFSEAESKVAENIHQKRNAINVVVNYNGQRVFTVNAATVKYDFNPNFNLNKAWVNHKTTNTNLSAQNAQYYSETGNLDFSSVDSMLDQIKNHVNTKPKNAEIAGFDPNSDYPYIIQDDVSGREINIEQAKADIQLLVESGTSGNVELQIKNTQAQITTEQLKSKFKLLNRSRTPISKDSTEQRTDNIRLAFSRYNGMKIGSGKRFSFNNVVGPRTLEAGFFEAVEYAYGEIVYGYGGGVCQASSTTYQAAVKSGLKIKKRVQHARTVNYTDPGLDATVYLTKNRNIDFVFENNTDHDIYIVARVIKDPSNRKRFMAETAIYGYSEGDIKYELETEKIQEIPAPTEVEYIQDKKQEHVIYTDQEYISQKASKGFVVATYLVKKVNGNIVSKETISQDTYVARPQRVYVGVTPR